MNRLVPERGGPRPAEQSRRQPPMTPDFERENGVIVRLVGRHHRSRSCIPVVAIQAVAGGQLLYDADSAARGLYEDPTFGASTRRQ